MTGAPELSVVVPTDCYETIAEVVRSLEAQSVAGSIELVLVTPAPERVANDRLEHLGFHGVKIVQALSSDNTLAAGDLAHVIGRSRSATSQHLKVLRDLGAVVARRDGNVVRYSLAPDLTGQVIADAVSAFDGLRSVAAAG